jgi:MraZ protein
MLTYAQLGKEAILVGTGNKVEVWNPSTYEKHQITDPSELSKLAGKYLNE